MNTPTLRACRPWTENRRDLAGTHFITMKRCCNGCGTALGDVTEEELDAAILGRTLPDVREECGCVVDPDETEDPDRHRDLLMDR